jgi:hypothetical protein
MSHRSNLRVDEDWSLPYRERIEKRRADEAAERARRREFRALMHAASEGKPEAVAYVNAVAKVSRLKRKTVAGTTYTVGSKGTYRRVPFDEKTMRKLKKLSKGLGRYGKSAAEAAKASAEFFDTVNNGGGE